jgi:benzoyl-CoA 2,3-dioxygenase component B
VVQRTAELMKEGTDPRKVGAIPLEIIQKYINEWSSSSYDLFGGEDSSNAAEAFAVGLKGRYREGDGLYKDPRALEQVYTAEIEENGRLTKIEIPLRRAMNALLLDAYGADGHRIVDRWNRILARYGAEQKLTLPSLRFNRHIGIHAGKTYDPSGQPISRDEFERKKSQWFPSEDDRAYVKSCMIKVHERGKFANWIAPPASGINEQPVDFEYVKFH